MPNSFGSSSLTCNRIFDSRSKRIVAEFGYPSGGESLSTYTSPFVHPDGFVVGMGQPKDSKGSNSVLMWDIRNTALNQGPTQEIKMHGTILFFAFNFKKREFYEALLAIQVILS